MFIVFMFPVTPQTTVEDMNYTVVVEGGILILSLAYYYFPKYGGVYWFTGPIPTLEKTANGEGSGRASTTDSMEKKERVAVSQQDADNTRR